VSNTSANAKCEHCGLINFASAESCKRCGSVLASSDSEAPPSRLPRTTKRVSVVVIGAVAAMVIISLVVLAYAINVRSKTRNPSSISSENFAGPKLRSDFVAQMKPATDKLARQMFEIYRTDELDRLNRRLQELQNESQRQIGESDADHFRRLIKARDEVVELTRDKERLRQMQPTNVELRLDVTDSDILLFHMTGNFADKTTQKMVEWWRKRSAEQQKEERDLRKLGFKTVILGDNVVGGERFEL